ncbi:MAG: polysaccharide deacetylase family protein [Paludibacteraceae bacterium]
MWFQYLYRGVIWRMDTTKKVVYLTFDDGPIPEVTPQVLAVLKRYGVKATFFMVGENADKYPELYEQVRAEGHSVGNHTYNHMKGLCVSTRTYMDNIAKADAVLGGTRLFRPPYGRFWIWQKWALFRAGYRMYLWDVLTHDYNACYSPERMLAIIKRYTRNGSIINFHDSVKSSDRMLATLPRAIEWLQQEGYDIQPL